MAETLLTPSSIKMYGRILTDLIFNYNANTVVIGNNNFLQGQFTATPNVQFNGTTTTGTLKITNASTIVGIRAGMTINNPAANVYLNNNVTTVRRVVPPATIVVADKAGTGAGGAQPMTASFAVNFARIYAFSFEGAIYSLPKPSIFLVHGSGLPIDLAIGNGGRTTTDMAGVVAREWEFSDNEADDPSPKLVYWEYEKGDFLLRLDTEAGPLEQILLAAAIRGADMADRSGANLGIRSGANLSGANVSGANVSGANLSGANLSGANLRNR